MKITSLRPSSQLGLFFWHVVWGPISALVAFMPLLVLHIFQFLSLLLLPFSRRAYRSYNRTIAHLVWGWWAWGIQHVIGVEVDITGDALPMRENAIVVANHQSMADIIVIMCLGLRQGRLADMKWMVKDVIKYVPGVGWGLIFLDALFLKRQWHQDAERIRATFHRYVSAGIPLWLVAFPEGTRLTPAKLKASQEFSSRVGLPLTQHVLVPRPKGFCAAVQGLKNHVDAVYVLTLIYDAPVAPTLAAMIRGDLRRVRIHVRRFAASSLPVGDKELAAWLNQVFLESDQLF